jgi:amino acid adenylation domain-containing protein
MSDATASSFRLSPQQERLWAVEPDGPRGRVQCTVVLPGDAEPERLQAALARVVERHEILRTTFQRHPGIRTPLQAVHGQLDPSWRAVELGGPAELAGLADEEAAAELDLEHGPLVRATHARLRSGGSALVLTVSALCSDGAGTTVLANDLLAAYEGSERRDPLQYADYAQWQNELLAADDDTAQEAHAYWQALAAAPTAPVSIAFADPSAPPTPPVSIDVPLAVEAVALLADREKAVPTLLAALAVIGNRFSGEDEIDVNFLDDGRHLDDLSDAVGAFARLIPLRVDFAELGDFAAVVGAIEAAVASGTRWRDYAPDNASRPGAQSLPLVVEWLEPSSSVGASATRRTTPERSLMTVAGSPEGLSILHEPSVLPDDDAERIAAGLASVLNAAAQGAGVAIDSMPLAEAVELERVLEAAAGPAAPPLDGTIQAAFQAQAAATPNRIAVSDDARSLTYDDLNRAANRVAHRLRSLGVDRGTVIGLCTDRSIDAIVGLLGILKAGGAYLPLHSEHPPARLAQLLAQTEAPVVVTQEPLLDSLEAFTGTIVCLDRDGTDLEAESDADPAEVAAPDDTVYVIYTSGSTGEPKGVAVTHANLRSYTAFIVSRLEADTRPLRFALVSALSTDLGNTVVFPALLSGGELRLVSPQVAMDGVALAQAAEEPYDVLKITPSHLAALLVGGGTAVLPREWLVLGGEACPWELVERIGELGSCRILNHYGPTEATVGCSTFDLAEDVSRWRPATVPTGRAIAGAACYVLDGGRGAVPAGVPGELYVAGAGVAGGTWPGPTRRPRGLSSSTALAACALTRPATACACCRTVRSSSSGARTTRSRSAATGSSPARSPLRSGGCPA